MEKILKKNAGLIGFVVTAVFACMLLAYALYGQGFIGNTNYLILAGAAVVVLDILILWSMAGSKVNNKKGGKK